MPSIHWYVNRIRDLISLAWHLFRNLIIVIVFIENLCYYSDIAIFGAANYYTPIYMGSICDNKSNSVFTRNESYYKEFYKFFPVSSLLCDYA